MDALNDAPPFAAMLGADAGSATAGGLFAGDFLLGERREGEPPPPPRVIAPSGGNSRPGEPPAAPSASLGSFSHGFGGGRIGADSADVPPSLVTSDSELLSGWYGWS